MFLKNLCELYKEIFRNARDIEREYSLNDSSRLKFIETLGVALSMHYANSIPMSTFERLKLLLTHTSPTTKKCYKILTFGQAQPYGDSVVPGRGRCRHVAVVVDVAVAEAP
jgi:hypothetical protein